MTIESPTKLTTTFHETLPFSRSGIGELLAAIAEHEKSDDANRQLTPDNYRNLTSLGTNQTKIFPKYARGLGLIDAENRLTAFGRLASQHDPTFSHTATLWIMHYNMAASHKNGPKFWNYLTEQHFKSNNTFVRETLASEIKQFSKEQGEKGLVDESYKKSATIFLGAYTEIDALGALGILENNGGVYSVREPKPVPVGAFACILADYWASVWRERDDVLLRDVNDGMLSSLLLLPKDQINDLLSELSERGLVTRQRRVPPFKVTRQWSDKNALWREHLYA